MLFRAEQHRMGDAHGCSELFGGCGGTGLAVPLKDVAGDWEQQCYREDRGRCSPQPWRCDGLEPEALPPGLSGGTLEPALVGRPCKHPLGETRWRVNSAQAFAQFVLQPEIFLVFRHAHTP